MTEVDWNAARAADARARGRYRCRAHPNQAVTWQGHGCPTCKWGNEPRDEYPPNKE